MSEPEQSSQQPEKKSAGQRFAELGPAWIGSIATLIVALTGAGFFAGHLTATSTQKVVVTKTVTATPSTPTSGAAASSSGSTATTSPAAPSDGVLLGSYTVTLTEGATAALGPTAPTAAQIRAGSGDDVAWGDEGSQPTVGTGGGDQMASLANGAPPTYQKCENDTQVTSQESSNPGTSFCILETAGRIAGVTVESINMTANPATIVLGVLVWSNAPS